MVIRHFSEIAAGADLPIVVFEYPPASGIGYAPETLARLTEIPQVAAVKDWSNDIVAFERNLRAVRATGRPVAMLSSFTMSLMATFLLGADGAISGMGSVAADLQAELFALCQKGDLDGARRVNDRLDPLVRVFYAPPFVDMHNRMKEALAILGRIPAAHVRPPLTPVSGEERQAIRDALQAARLSRWRALGPQTPQVARGAPVKPWRPSIYRRAARPIWPLARAANNSIAMAGAREYKESTAGPVSQSTFPSDANASRVNGSIGTSPKGGLTCVGSPSP